MCSRCEIGWRALKCTSQNDCCFAYIITFYLFDSANFNQNCYENSSQVILIAVVVVVLPNPTSTCCCWCWCWCCYLHRFFIQQISITDNAEVVKKHTKEYTYTFASADTDAYKQVRSCLLPHKFSPCVRLKLCCDCAPTTSFQYI